MTSFQVTDDRGVSTIIGAILITGILITALVTVQVSFVPVWQKATEKSRLVEVESQLTKLISDIERQVDNRSSTALAHPLSLSRQSTGFFGGASLSDSMQLRAASATYDTDANRLLILQNNGVNFAGLNPAWASIPGSTTLADIVRIDALRLRVDHIDVFDDGDFVEMRVRDSTNALVGSFRLDVIDPTGAGSSYYITVTTADDVGNVITSVTYSHHQQVEFTPYYEDALSDVYLFDQLLASATVPLSLELENSAGFGADYNIAYVEAGAGGLPVLVGSSGILKVPYSATYTSQGFEYRVPTRQMPPSTFVYEHGALILEQNDGAAFKLSPSFTVDRANDITSLAFNLPSLAGDPFVRTGTANAVVVTSATGHTDLVANGPNFVVTLQTEYPALWGDFFTDTLEAAGLASPSQFTVDSTTVANQVTVSVIGSDPSPTNYDLSIALNQATITVTAES